MKILIESLKINKSHKFVKSKFDTSDFGGLSRPFFVVFHRYRHTNTGNKMNIHTDADARVKIQNYTDTA